MKFADRAPAERTAIDAWIRVVINAREKACLHVTDDFKQAREKIISELPDEIEKMLRFYRDYQKGRHTVSYTDYFQVSHPEEYAAIMQGEHGRA